MEEERTTLYDSSVENEQATPDNLPAESDASAEEVTEKPNRTKKKRAMIALAVIVIAIAAILVVQSQPSKFETVAKECCKIVWQDGNAAWMFQRLDNFFAIDTHPEEWDTRTLDWSGNEEKHALEAIQHANTELGFSRAVYEKMLNTNALMGRQTEENEKYRVSWTYHPDNGLEVMYEEK